MTAHRGKFPYCGTLGSRLYQIAASDSKCEQKVLETIEEALEFIPQVRVKDVVIAEKIITVYTIQIMITPPSGIKAVTNAEPFIGGMDAEDDNAFRARLLKSYANISNGTNAAFYRELAMKHPSVYSAGVVAKDDGVGTVSVYVATRGGVPSDEVIEELQKQFDEARELNVAVTVKPAVLQQIPLRIQIKPAKRYSFEQAKEICMQVIDDYFAQMHIGGIFRVAELCRNMLESGAIANHYTPPGADYSMPQNKLVVKGNIIIEEGGVM